MNGFWTWLKDEANRKVLGWIVAGLGSIAIYFGFFKPEEKKKVIAPASQTAISTGGTAINASGSSVVNTNLPDANKPSGTAQQPSPLPTPLANPQTGAPATPSGGQTATSSGGTAVNASGNAQVNVKP